MSDIADDLRMLARAVAAEAAPRATRLEWRDLWSRLGDVGITGVGSLRSAGEPSGDLDDLCACVEEVAAAGLSTPLVENGVARWVRGPDHRHEGLCTVAVTDSDLQPEDGTLTATVSGVRWADSARDVVLVGAAGGPIAVDLRSTGVKLTVRPDLAGEPVGTLYLNRAPVELLTEVTNDEALTRLRILRAGALLAAARGAYDLTKAYVSTREQFGAPLLRIPAVANNLAVMRTEIIQATAGLDRARDRAGSSQSVAARIARLMSSRSATRVAALAHQLHGAMGVTEEYPLHRLTRRIWAWRDADVSERDEAIALGRLAFAGGEENYWTSVTA
ncbi:acyl-CoA dehydrogenase family protein [Streptomyces sp. NPDC055078]